MPNGAGDGCPKSRTPFVFTTPARVEPRTADTSTALCMERYTVATSMRSGPDGPRGTVATTCRSPAAGHGVTRLGTGRVWLIRSITDVQMGTHDVTRGMPRFKRNHKAGHATEL